MEFCHNDEILGMAVFQQLGQFVREWQSHWRDGPPDFERFEQELHEHIMAVERAMLTEELARYDVTAAEIEVDGAVYRPTLTASETYLSAAGPITVTRHLYRPSGRGSKSICPLELRVGIIRGYWTPRAARQGAFVMAHLTPGDSQALFAELGSMQPSRASLDRLPKELSAHWEKQRTAWEVALRAQEPVPLEATVIALSVDGVMLRLQGSSRADKQGRPGKHASGPTGQREAGCGTVVLYDKEGQRLQTVRYGRMPEPKKATLEQQLAAEAKSVLAVQPELQRVLLADGAEPNWRLLAEVDQACGPPPQPSIEIVDFFHACDHLKEGCDAAWGESTPRSHAEFERLKTLLKEADDGPDRVIRVLKYHRGRAKGRKRQRLAAQLTYFRNQRQRMHYAQYLRDGLPIASGIIEATCKTLVTQRLKQSGMAWTQPGGQAILTLRSLIQSRRWPTAWQLLQADFRTAVTICSLPETRPICRQPQPFHKHQPPMLFEPIDYDYAALPLAI
jgi:hypothetical protein